MIFYLGIFSLLSLIILNSKRSSLSISLITIFFIVFVGFRYEVGGDWITYLENYKNFNYSLAEYFQLSIRESGWIISTYISKLISSNEIWPLNLICSTIFFIGLWQFSLKQKEPLLVFLLAYPVLICLVAMGYTRQSAALGFELLGLSRLGRNKFPWFTFILAGLFHNTFLIVALYLYLLKSRKMLALLKTILTLLIFTFIINLFIPLIDYYWNAIGEYIFIGAFIAEGAIYRSGFYLAASIAYLYLAKGFINRTLEDLIYLNMAFGSLVLILFIFLLPLTAFDRLLLYLSPLYLYTFSNITFVSDSHNNLYIILLIIIFGLFTVIWFVYGLNSSYWIPYNNYLFIWFNSLGA